MANIWKYAALILIGFAIGFAVHAKFICDPGPKINKIKIKGQGNQQEIVNDFGDKKEKHRRNKQIDD